jgi:hypothetical protein
MTSQTPEQQPAAAAAPQSPGQPNRFELAHGHITITYMLDDPTGPNPQFTYDDHGKTQTFTGSQIQRSETPIGTLVSVVIKPSVDADRTLFSVMLPLVNLSQETSCPIDTFGVTTVVHTTLSGPRRGQMDDYTTSHPFKGTASIVLT